MEKLANKPSPHWWILSPGYRRYHIREYSGIFIALWALGFLSAIIFPPTSKYMPLFNSIGFIGAMLHSITWLIVMPNVTPFQLSTLTKRLAFTLLIFLWIAISIALIFFL